MEEIDIVTAMIQVASQENADDLEHDLLMEAAEYIKELRQQIELLNNR